MAIYPIENQPFTYRADARGVWVRSMIWERSKRAPVTIETFLSYTEVRAYVAAVEIAREDEAQERVF